MPRIFVLRYRPSGTSTHTYNCILYIILHVLILLFLVRYSFVKGTDKCSSCGFPLMTRAFYVFPCMHRFHSDCLIAEVSITPLCPPTTLEYTLTMLYLQVVPHLVSSKRVEELQRKLASQEHSGATRSMPNLPNQPDTSVKVLTSI